MEVVMVKKIGFSTVVSGMLEVRNTGRLRRKEGGGAEKRKKNG